MLPLLVALAASAVTVETTGTCPGVVTIDSGDLTPSGTYVILRGTGVGSARVPGGPCADTVSGLAGPLNWHGPFRADGLGRGGLAPSVPALPDGTTIQILDITTCELSPAVALCGGDGLVYEADFDSGVTPSWQCDEWVDWKLGVDSGYSRVTLSGSSDPVGITCADPAVVDTVARAIRDDVEVYEFCDGHWWSYCPRYGGSEGELFIDSDSACDPSNCPSPGYILRPCQENENWGGAGTATCSPPSQSLRFELE